MNPRGTWTWLYEAPPDVIVILAVGTVWFLTFYAVQFRRWGTVSIGTWIFGFDFFLKIVVMYPFARSPENIISLGRALAAATSHVDEALRITAGGVIAMLAGMLLTASRSPSLRFPVLDFLHDALRRGWCHPLGVLVATGLAMASTASLVALGFKPLVARSLVFEEPTLRPAFNLWYELIPFAALCVTTNAIIRPSWRGGALGCFLALLGVFGGNRNMVVMTLIQCWVIWAMPARRRDVIWPLIGCGLLVFVALILSGLRGDDAHAGSSGGGLDELLYGNNLSDLRDFAWILSGLYGTRYMGLTYLAGYLSFIPSTLLEFRYDMAFGRVSAMLAGLDPSEHSGLRPPLFGELFVNFGWPGVLLGGAAFGVVLKRILIFVSRALSEDPAERRYVPPVAVWTGFVAYEIATSFVFTPSFFGVYVIAAMVMLGGVLAWIDQ